MAFQLPHRTDIEAMFRLALPVVVVQVGMMLLGVVDTMVVGRLSYEALAAVALGHVVVVAVSSFGVGFCWRSTRWFRRRSAPTTPTAFAATSSGDFSSLPG